MLVSEKRLLVEHLKHYSLRELLKTDFWRASALTKILLRRKLAERGQKQKYYASVPWYFALGVPAVLAGRVLRCWLRLVWPPALAGWRWRALRASSCSIWPFVSFLRRQRGWGFFVQSCLFLVPDMFVSGLGILHGAG